MRARASVCLGLLVLPLLSITTPVHAGGFESAVLAEINAVRANPRAYARELRREQVLEARYRDEGYGYGMSQEDPGAVDEAIDFLMRQPPRGPWRTIRGSPPPRAGTWRARGPAAMSATAAQAR